MRVAELNSVRLHWREDGDPDGLPVVFANSLGTDLRLWDGIIPLLPKGLRLIRFDKRGHGLSECPPSPYRMEELALDAAELLDLLGVRDCVFVGLSIGGMIAQTLAATRPDLVKAMVLSNTAAKMGDAEMWNTRITAIEAGGIESLAAPILERWFSAAFHKAEAFEAWSNMLTRTPRAGYIGCCHAIAAVDLHESTGKLTLPTLCIAGSEDGASPPDLVKGTANLIPGSQFRIIDGVGHLPCVEAPAEYSGILSAFLKEAHDV